MLKETMLCGFVCEASSCSVRSCIWDDKRSIQPQKWDIQYTQQSLIDCGGEYDIDTPAFLNSASAEDMETTSSYFMAISP